MTRLIAPGLFALLLAAGPAEAINWEGHDDWLADVPPAQELEKHFEGSAAPLRVPRPELPCVKHEEVGRVAANPYDQVPMVCPEPSAP